MLGMRRNVTVPSKTSVSLAIVAIIALTVFSVPTAHAASATVTTMKSNFSYIPVGGAVALKGTVTDSSSNPTTPTGTLTWSDGGAGGTFTVKGAVSDTCKLKTVSSSSSSCKVAYTPPASAAAGVSITISADYSGDSSHGASSAQMTFLVLRSTSTTITPQNATVGLGGSQTFTATVVDISPGTPITPTGTVKWSASPPHGNHFSSRTCALVTINSTASSCSISYWSAKGGSRGIMGTYLGDLFHAESKGNALLIIVS